LEAEALRERERDGETREAEERGKRAVAAKFKKKCGGRRKPKESMTIGRRNLTRTGHRLAQAPTNNTVLIKCTRLFFRVSSLFVYCP
jgi:hypothetical protein